MALIDHKIPILAGINDIPSITGDTAHPNASLLCSKFNALIEDIAPSTIETTSYNIYVNSATGNDLTGDGSELLPYQTIEKGIAFYKGKVFRGYCNLWLAGTFTNPRFDFDGVKFDSTNHTEGWAGTNTLYIKSTNVNACTFVINTSYPIIVSNTSDIDIYFSNITFELGITLILRNNQFNYYFDSCYFHLVANSLTTLLFDNSVGLVQYCTFVSDTLQAQAIRLYTMSRILADGNIFTNYTNCFNVSEGSSIYNVYDSNYYEPYAQAKYYVENATAIVANDSNQLSDYTILGAAVVFHYNGIFIENHVLNKEGVDTTNLSYTIKPTGATAWVNIQDADLTLNNSAKVIKIGGNKVLGERQPTIPDATTGTEVATINSILTALRNHGIIAT